MSITTHERPGVYSQYDASAVVSGSGGGQTVGIAALCEEGTAGTLYTFTRYEDAAAAFGETEELTELIRLVLLNGAAQVKAVPVAEAEGYEDAFAVLEQEEDVCSGTSKANSGIIHAGYDAVPGTKKAYYNVRGAQRLPELSRRLDFEFEQRGSLLVCFDPQRLDELEALQARGLENGVSGLRILSPEELYALEPNIAPGAVGALFAPTAGIVCPFGMTIAFAENAADNGAQFFFEQSVRTVERSPEGYRVTIHRGNVQRCRFAAHRLKQNEEEARGLPPRSFA